MPEDNLQPTRQPNQPDSSVASPQVIQPADSSVVSPPSSEPQPVVSSVTTQPTAVANGQPFQPTTPMSSSQFEQLSEQKPSKWRYFFIVLGMLQALGVGIFFFVMTWAIQQAKAGVSGTEFIGLIVYVTLVPAVGLIAFINLVGLPMYMRRHKPHGKGMVFSILSLLVSVILALYGAYSVYQFRVATPKHIQQLSQQSQQKIQAQQQQFTADNSKPEITKDEAIQLLKTCKLKGFYYTNQTTKDDSGNWGELSSTGVVLTKIDGKPYRISIADRLIPELVPIAREAQKTCGDPQFWHGGNYEQYKNGHWYFNGQVVN
ncbi:MAG: hypothetical protein JWS12_288 [Candidatus Saccharibacteria bacterium]|nr:hypothetical protein [Candidatus Saccharibacteria bacterium]